jgi:hypothetical protein
MDGTKSRKKQGNRDRYKPSKVKTKDSSNGFEHASMNSRHGKKQTNVLKGARQSISLAGLSHSCFHWRVAKFAESRAQREKAEGVLLLSTRASGSPSGIFDQFSAPECQVGLTEVILSETRLSGISAE